ncbi:37S ribosomal protein S22 [Recurvomyces mirabilis]|uniref:37S ribosomal protein S22 n=1 Tax=Recurvomyces mirabilis TaxID=574656 RepID=A0AAE0WMA3_9PEZI|nr:37S ribosomal protein S22 [Recurvomyces mirabilis]KAK5154150.1 37S ribosomal protein S22 [Recurvomyces mirabilis]
MRDGISEEDGGMNEEGEGEEGGGEASMEDVGKSLAERVLKAREKYGSDLPAGVLAAREMRLWVGLYGSADQAKRRGGEGENGYGEEGLSGSGLDERVESLGTGVLRMAEDGALEEIEFEGEGVVGGEGKKKSAKSAKIQKREEIRLGKIDEGEGGSTMANHSRHWTEADEYRDEDAEPQEEEEDTDPTQRTHPFTLANRFGTSPSTLPLPKDTFVDPATLLLSGLPTVHLSQAATRIFGGLGLPYSTSTPNSLKTMQPKPIALDVFQDRMSSIETDVYTAVLMPAVYASVMSVLRETRKRLGSAWAEDLVRKAERGELRVLDVGGAGAGVLAVRELIRAEWDRMHDRSTSSSSSASSGGAADSPMDLAEADGRIGGAGLAPPQGHATVLVASDGLRKRASQLLENTTFIPRLPDYIHSSSTSSTEKAQRDGKFDLIIAPHSLWPLREDFVRRTHVQNLWSLLKKGGGVMVVLEKGVSRGFELVAGARELLLETRISSPEARERSLDIYDDAAPNSDYATPAPEPLTRTKEKGMIIAPCTNHSSCPMYVQKGMVKGRLDICHFEQRFVRPSFLQKVLGARDKNFEDVRFAHVAVMRGRDLREEKKQEEEGLSEESVAEAWGQGLGLKQGVEATEMAFVGHAAEVSEPDTSSSPQHTAPSSASLQPSTTTPHPLTLPLSILPPLKRRGHIILDLCTPSGTLERWTVPRSFGKQAFRDARKSSWGDGWALGAKTRVVRTVRKNKFSEKGKGKSGVCADGEAKIAKKSARAKAGSSAGAEDDEMGMGKTGDFVVDADEYGRLVVKGGGSAPGDRRGQKRTHRVKGVRDKRDKSGKGNGRRKYQVDE